jgi:two-component system osmolarity sensor histidine kinase EnvZ
MMRFLVPRSLRARMILLILGTVILVQGATFATVSHYRQQFVEDVAVQYTATTIRTLRASLAEVEGPKREEIVRQASRNEWRLWSRDLPSNTRMEDRRPSQQADATPLRSDVRQNLRTFVQALNNELGEGIRVGLSRGPEPSLYISLLPDAAVGADGKHKEWLVIPLDRIAPPMASPIVIAWITGTVILLLLSSAFSWHITRPLSRLAQAADKLASGHPQRVTPSGPSETRVLGQRFNAMLDTLAESQAVQRTLLAGLPHDLKGPLSRMWLRVEMATDPSLQEGMRKDIQDMQRMVNQFIGFVRGSDPASYLFTPLSLNDWLQERVDAWKSAGSPVTLRCQDVDNMRINADSVALDRLLDNLITNAMNHGQTAVEISLVRQGKSARIQVIDHGPGICPERREEALRPFSRLDEARTRTGSVGLGLALAHTIAKAHDGLLMLDDTPDGGLTVTVLLPLHQEHGHQSGLKSGGAGATDRPNIRQ